MQLFANNAASVLANGMSSAATTLQLAPGTGARFPNPANGNYFLLTLFQMSGSTEVNHEIVKCSARNGDTLTIQRAQEGSTARTFSTADPVSLRLTAGSFSPTAFGLERVDNTPDALKPVSTPQAQAIAAAVAGNPGALVLLATLKPTQAANVDALNVFNANYDSYWIVGTGIAASADDSLQLRVANAGVVDSSSLNYYETNLGAEQYAPSHHIDVGAVTRNTGKGISFSIHLHNVNDATRLKFLDVRAASQNTVPTPGFFMWGRGACYLGGVVSGIRLYWVFGSNFAATGSLRIYGYKNG